MGYSYEMLNDLWARKSDLSGRRVLTLGVLHPYLSRREQGRLRKTTGLKLQFNERDFSREYLVNAIGAEVCHALDVSDYQGAELIGDLNCDSSLFESHKGAYDFIIDAGTLEHLSHVPNALNNIFMMLKDGGYYYFGAPCNGWVNHGLFQFSPTFYRDLCFGNRNTLLLKSLIVDDGKRVARLNTDKDSLIIDAFRSNRKRLNVKGLIKKLDNSELNFAFIQEKYRNWHVRDEASVSQRKSCWMTFRRRLGQRVIHSRLLPFQLKMRLFGVKMQ